MTRNRARPLLVNSGVPCLTSCTGHRQSARVARAVLLFWFSWGTWVGGGPSLLEGGPFDSTLGATQPCDDHSGGPHIVWFLFFWGG